ncbi:hypothetical protein Hanom_Chr00s000694g01655101 [Helianthus anomalus]
MRPQIRVWFSFSSGQNFFWSRAWFDSGTGPGQSQAVSVHPFRVEVQTLVQPRFRFMFGFKARVILRFSSV